MGKCVSKNQEIILKNRYGLGVGAGRAYRRMESRVSTKICLVP